jgi:hypothetical protein
MGTAAARAQRDRIRRVVLGIIEEQGPNGETQELRQRLASALF